MNRKDSQVRASCPIHGRTLKRSACRQCNAGYMREYQRCRRARDPATAIIERARERAAKHNLAYSLRADQIEIPRRCPVLGIEVRHGNGRSGNSPSLDRLRPRRGYVSWNVRVISDRANQLKGAWTLDEIRRLARTGARRLRAEYALIAKYIEREELLQEVRIKAERGGAAGEEWRRLADFLERRFRKDEVTRAGINAPSSKTKH